MMTATKRERLPINTVHVPELLDPLARKSP